MLLRPKIRKCFELNFEKIIISFFFGMHMVDVEIPNRRYAKTDLQEIERECQISE